METVVLDSFACVKVARLEEDLAGTRWHQAGNHLVLGSLGIDQELYGILATSVVDKEDIERNLPAARIEENMFAEVTVKDMTAAVIVADMAVAENEEDTAVEVTEEDMVVEKGMLAEEGMLVAEVTEENMLAVVDMTCEHYVEAE